MPLKYKGLPTFNKASIFILELPHVSLSDPKIYLKSQIHNIAEGGCGWAWHIDTFRIVTLLSSSPIAQGWHDNDPMSF